MNAVLRPVADGTTLAARLAAYLGDGAWAADFDRWPPQEAMRWRAVLAAAGDGRLALLADRAEEAPLRRRLEARLRAPLQWAELPADELALLLREGTSGLRALDALEDPAGESAGHAATQELSPLGRGDDVHPVVRLLDATLYDALHDGASDVHFESTARGLTIRCRIDGVMQPVRRADGVALAEQLVSRLKVMAELDIGERRLPQDGRFKLRVRGREIDFRLSIMPSVFGEDAVIRVLDRAQLEDARGAPTLESLGFAPALRERIRALARQPHGLLLVTGPTGSGKTTTLYAAIAEINDGRDKIVTIEDPVEYQLPGVVQIPVNEKKGLSFARGLRSVLRHDPDRVMVGEIRDAETAQIAVQAALTGHLVFSTVHANGVFDVVGRFMHMGLDLHNVVGALNAVLAQRLMRLNCRHCRVPTLLSGERLRALGLEAGHAYAHGSGCPQCRGTGYRGRRAIAELLLLDDELRDLIASRAPIARIKEAARARGLRPLRDAALDAVRDGDTTPEELERVTLAG